MKKEPRDYTITALERGLKVLMLFDGEKSSYTLTELSFPGSEKARCCALSTPSAKTAF